MPYFYKKSYVIDEIYDGPIAKSSLGPSTKKYDLAGNRGYYYYYDYYVQYRATYAQ